MRPPSAHPHPLLSLCELRVATGNRYAVLKRLGSGGMAQVYLAKHAVLALADTLLAFLGQAPGADLRSARSSRPSGLPLS